MVIIVGGSVFFFLVIMLYLVYGGEYLQQHYERRTRTKGFDHSIARSALPELRFRKPEPADVDQIVSLSREPHTMAANRWGPEEAVQHENFLRSDRFDTFARLSLVAELTTNPGEIVGVGSLDLRPNTSAPSIGVHVATAHGGRGFGTELMAAMILLTQQASPGSAWVGTAVDNHAMQQIMAKLGYEPGEGTVAFRGSDGSIVQSLWYQVGTQGY